MNEYFHLFLRLKYKHLYLLKTLNEQGNLHLTALKMNMSQPAATRMLGEIERLFDCRLFDRGPRGLAANDAGHLLVDFAYNALSRLDRCTDELHRLQSGGKGQLKIGAIMGAAPDLVAHCIIEMKRRYPLLKISLSGETSDQLIELLGQGRIDLAVSRHLPSHQQTEFEFEPLGSETILAVVRQGHPLLGSPFPPLSKLLEAWPWILQPPSTPARQMLEQAFERAGLLSPRDVIESGSIFASLQLVQRCEAILVLSESILREPLDSGRVVELPLPFADALGPFGLLQRRGETLGPPAKRFAELLRIRARALDDPAGGEAMNGDGR
ncbi:LysR family transcriptional regulator [Halotalea alkalilenta]|uniref:LysR family transcriptional regulator n=1 Tax=Halotalea alkalilenta TaxID=376489 RepID=UPI0006938D0A|nr:LysR family transcriptional regulator [Halotalea alkalilenta]